MKFLRLPVVYRLSINMVSIVNSMLYIIVCVWSININIKGLISCLLEPIRYCICPPHILTLNWQILPVRKGSSPQQPIFDSLSKHFVHVVMFLIARKIVRWVNWLASKTAIFPAYQHQSQHRHSTTTPETTAFNVTTFTTTLTAQAHGSLKISRTSHSNTAPTATS